MTDDVASDTEQALRERDLVERIQSTLDAVLEEPSQAEAQALLAKVRSYMRDLRFVVEERDF